MKPHARTVSVVAVASALLALPYLFFFYKPFDPSIIATSLYSNAAVSSLELQQQSKSPQLAPTEPSSYESEGFASSEIPETSAGAATAGSASAEIAEGISDASLLEESSDAALEAMLASAATPDKTVIITTLNQAWAKPGTMIDVFLESFQKGENTSRLLNHLVMVALDRRSFQRCQELHRHCFMLTTPGVDFSGSKGFMTKDFLRMMWRRMGLLRSVLEMGYNFVFTDADILWLRDPFAFFAPDTDFQIACDKNRGNAFSVLNQPNCGYQYARANERTVAMYRHWCRAGEATPDVDEQSLLNRMLHGREFAQYRVSIRFLPTERFSGFCQKSKNMSRVVTMHANCCTGLSNKVQDLRTALRAFHAGQALPPETNTTNIELWHVPDACLHSLWPSPPPPPIPR